MQQQENEVKTMPQARQYESAAARQAAYRERQKQAQSAQLQTISVTSRVRSRKAISGPSSKIRGSGSESNAFG